MNLSTTDKIHLKCDCSDGDLMNGMRESTLFNFVLDNPPGKKLIGELETIQFKNLLNLF